MCLRLEDRKRLEAIAAVEDRDLGYVCSWFVEWGMELYVKLGVSLRDLKELEISPDKTMQKRAAERLKLREEAQGSHEKLPGTPERKLHAS